jgi:hypothetical protein
MDSKAVIIAANMNKIVKVAKPIQAQHALQTSSASWPGRAKGQPRR